MVQYQDKVATTSALSLLSCELRMDSIRATEFHFADMAEKRFFGMQESLNTKYQQYTTRGTITKRWFLRTERT
jgi:hypothetical protein